MCDYIHEQECGKKIFLLISVVVEYFTIEFKQ